jgi:3-oxoacyl-[acyl-carrier-protein] synthase III
MFRDKRNGAVAPSAVEEAPQNSYAEFKASLPTRQVRYAHVVGWGMKVPDRVVTNADLEGVIDTSDDWIRNRTGIHERRFASERDSLASLGFEAARNALDRADISPRDLDLIIVATSTPEDFYPSAASKIQTMLGASHAGAFDLSAACSGFVYATNMAAQAIRTGSMERALIIGVEINSRVLDWTDRSTCVLFGDGAGAIVLEGSERPGGWLSCILGSNGAGGDLLGIPTAIRTNVPEGQRVNKIHMDGREVFRFAVNILQESISKALKAADLTIADVDVIIPHQANQRILSAAARGLNIPEAMFYSNLHRYGNTSAASIPIALCEAEEDGKLLPDDNVVLVGFGGGLTWAAATLTWQTERRPIQAGLWGKIGNVRREARYVFAFWRTMAQRLSRRLFANLRRRPGRVANLKGGRTAKPANKTSGKRPTKP